MPTLIPPSENTGTYSDGRIRGNHTDLYRFYAFPVGIAIVKRNGLWALERGTIQADTADEYFLGGRTHTIDDTKAAELTAAGFGAYIT